MLMLDAGYSILDRGILSFFILIKPVSILDQESSIQNPETFKIEYRRRQAPSEPHRLTVFTVIGGGTVAIFYFGDQLGATE